MKNKILLFLALVLFTVIFSFNITLATDETPFSMTEVEVIDFSTLKISFSKDLIENSWDVSEFLLTAKNDESTKIDIENIALGWSNELILTLSGSLTWLNEYNLIAIFVSDKDWNIIESWVNGMITFLVPEQIEVVEEEVILDAAPIEVVEDSENAVSVEEVSTTAEALPITWTKESLILILSLILWLSFFYVYKKS